MEVTLAQSSGNTGNSTQQKAAEVFIVTLANATAGESCLPIDYLVASSVYQMS